MILGAEKLSQAEPLSFVEVVGLPPGNYKSFVVPSLEAGGGVPPGAEVAVNIDDRDLRDGRVFAIVHEGAALLRTYRTNPERWECAPFPVAPTIFPRSPVEIIGCAVGYMTKL